MKIEEDGSQIEEDGSHGGGGGGGGGPPLKGGRGVVPY